MQNILVSLIVGAAIGYAAAMIYKAVKRMGSRSKDKDSNCGGDGCDGCDGCK